MVHKKIAGVSYGLLDLLAHHFLNPFYHQSYRFISSKLLNSCKLEPTVLRYNNRYSKLVDCPVSSEYIYYDSDVLNISAPSDQNPVLQARRRHFFQDFSLGRPCRTNASSFSKAVESYKVE